MPSGVNKSVQARNVDAVIDYYNARGNAAFGIVQGQQMIIQYNGADISEGEQILQQALTLIEESGETSVYSLFIYDLDEPGKTKINNKTPYNSSINFRLYDVNDPGAPTRRNLSAKVGNVQVNQNGQTIEVNNVNRELLEEIKAMRLELNAMKKEAEDKENESSLGVIGEIMEHPAIEPIVPALINRVLDWIEGKPAGTTQGTVH